ncbi:MAG TPA: DUF6328 family protein [Streptosporangiaceae bacterium]|jgi:hypothetical protein|nr:DUF6328 family protein [Streptosporangiaceae bacterium]
MTTSDRRDETEAERDDRNLMELLQELRVAGLGVQVLFGFLLSLPFTAKFSKLTHPQRELYVTVLLLSAVATILLVGPVAYHRLVLHLREKRRLIRIASAMALAGLAAEGLAVCGAVLLVVSYVDRGLSVIIIPAAVFGLFAGLWFGLPLLRRARAESRVPSGGRMPSGGSGER